MVLNFFYNCQETTILHYKSSLFMELSETRYSFFKAVVLSSVLFGIWHIAAPVRRLLDGDISVPGAVISALVLVLTTGITGAKFCLLTKITGSLWMPMAQTISFLIVLFIYWKTGAHNKQTFRA